MSSADSAPLVIDSKPQEFHPYSTNTPYLSYASAGPDAGYEPEIVKAPVPLVDHHRKRTTPVFIIVVASLLFAIAAALGHHFFNRHLDGTPVRSVEDERFLTGGTEYIRKWSHGQTAALLVGNVLAQLVKVCLGTAVGVAFVQRAWRTVSRERLTIKGCDAVFGVATSVTSFVSLDLWRVGWLTACVAVVLWSLVVVTIFPVASLTSKQIAISKNSIYKASSMDYNSASSMWAERAILSTLVSSNPISPTSPCGNCSFTQQLYAPALSCSNGLAAGVVNSNYSMWDNDSEARIWDAETYNDDWTTLSSEQAYVGYGTSIAIRHMDLDASNTARNLSCTVTNASYTILSNFTTTPGVTSVQNLTREDWWSATNGIIFIEGENITNDALARMNFDAQRDSLFKLLNGTWWFLLSGTAAAQILAVSSLFNGTYWVDDMPAAMEDLMSNITLSLLTKSLNANTPVNATLLNSELVFKYSAPHLYGPYIYAVVISLLACLSGVHAMRENGFAAAAGFQSFVDASRSQSMMDPDVLAGRARIRYGELPGTDGRFGFIKEEYLGTEKYGQGIPLHTR